MPGFDPTMLSGLTDKFPGASGLVPSSGDFSNLLTNFMNQRYATQMYKRTRADNIEFWNMQNEYNLPDNQMARFKAAGLNPNLIYGQGNAGNAGGIPTPDVQSVDFRPVLSDHNTKPDLMATLLGQADLRIKDAQVDNIRAQNAVIRQDALLKAKQTERSAFDLSFDTDLRDTQADYQRERVRNLQTQTDLSMNKDAREAVLGSQSVAESLSRMQSMREQRLHSQVDRQRMRENIDLMQKQGVTIDLENELRKQGINPSDPMWARVVGRFLANVFDNDGSFHDTTGNIWSWLFGN